VTAALLTLLAGLTLPVGIGTAGMIGLARLWLCYRAETARHDGDSGSSR
jgi:hypothetical protein